MAGERMDAFGSAAPQIVTGVTESQSMMLREMQALFPDTSISDATNRVLVHFFVRFHPVVVLATCCCCYYLWQHSLFALSRCGFSMLRAHLPCSRHVDAVRVPSTFWGFGLWA